LVVVHHRGTDGGLGGVIGQSHGEYKMMIGYDDLPSQEHGGRLFIKRSI